jgi:putative peptide zinc metalloprotease protein
MWYRVAELRPRLHAGLHISRQRYRGRSWYVLHNPATGRSHRFTPATYALIDGMDGSRTLDELWLGLVESLGDHAPSQGDVIQLLHQLHAADVLHVGGLPELNETLERRRKQARPAWVRSLVTPMSMRFPLWDPSRFVNGTWPFVRWLISPLGAALWLAFVLPAAVLAARHWNELTVNLADRVLGLENLLLLWLTYPVVKFLHELGHAYAVRRGGGQVHEMGIMLLVFAPVPYVDASSSSAFRSKWARIGVAAAGILTELFVAALAMFVWAAAEPGIVRAMAFNVLLLCGASSLLFNANPLLRFDGYYVLCDLVEIPNLAQRANQYLQYLFRRHVYRDHEAQSPAHGRAEAVWMGLYAPASWVYRVFITLGIALFIAGKYFFIGVLLALWTVVGMFVVPLAKGVMHLAGQAQFNHQRRRAIGLTSGVVAAILAFVCFVPMPYTTVADGVVWTPRNAEVRVETGGFVDRLFVDGGAEVEPGEPLVELRDPELAANLWASEARVEQYATKYASEMFADRLQAAVTQQTLATERAALERLQARDAGLVAQAGRRGTWRVANPQDLYGRYYEQGALLGFVLSGQSRTIRVVVPQGEADLVRNRTQRIEVRLVDRPWQTFRAKLSRDVPAASDLLPTKALTLDGGGPFATDPRDSSGLKTLTRTFQFDLDLLTDASDLAFGSRAYVRFEHRARPIAAQVYHSVRQVLLAHLEV